MKAEDKALMDIIQGREAEKKIQVTVGVHKKVEPTEEEIAAKKERDEALSTARMPWFCPSCSAVMNGNFDRKFYYLRGTCFDCVIKEETKMRMNGTFELYERRIMLQNALGRLLDAESELATSLYTIAQPSFVHENGGVEAWVGVDLDEVKEKMAEDLNEIRESIQDIKNDLREVDDEFERRTKEVQQA